jgi:MFS family permease
MQFLFAPVWGKLSDIVGRRPILLIGLIGSAISYLIFGLAQDFNTLLISRCFAGICGATITTAFAYITDVTSNENRAKGMGMIGAAFGLGFIFGPILTGVFSGHSETLPIFIAAGICFFNFLLASIRLPESLIEKKRHVAGLKQWLPLNNLIHLIKIPKIPFLYLIYFMTIFAFASMESTFALMGQKIFGLNIQSTSYIFVFIGVLSAIMQGGLIGRLSKKFGEKKLMLVGQCLLAVGVVCLPFSGSIYVLLFATAIVALGFGMSNPSVSSLISKVAPEKEKGFVLGGAQGMGSLGRILGPIVGTLGFQLISVSFPFVLGGGVLALTILTTLIFVES